MASVTQYLANLQGKWDQKWQGTDGSAHVTSSAQAANGTILTGQVIAPLVTAGGADLFTAKAGTALTLALLAEGGAAPTEVLYYSTNYVATSDVDSPATRRALGVGERVTINFADDDLCVQVRYKASGALTNSTLFWELKELS